MRKRLLALLIALAAIVAATGAQSFWQSRSQVAISGGGGGCTTATFDKDGTVQSVHNASATTITTPPFSTSFCNDLVVVIASTVQGVLTVTDAQGHLTFTRHIAAGGSVNWEIWTAPLSGAALSGDTITVTSPIAANFVALVTAFSGYKTATPFDSNAAIPNGSTAGQCSWTTSNANDILFGVGTSNNSSPDAGWTLLSDSTAFTNFLFAEYKIVSATQSGVTAATITGGSACDAIQQGP